MADDDKKEPDQSNLTEHLEAFDEHERLAQENRKRHGEDKSFAYSPESQWPQDVRKRREDQGRPCLTINQLPSFIRKVTNDARLNKPAIKVKPADSVADPETARVLAGLIKHIETDSNAGVAYQTGIEGAVSGGFGYWRIDLEHAQWDSFDLDIKIRRIINEYSVYEDPYATEPDSSDWDSCFVVDEMPEHIFKARWKKAEKVDWERDPRYNVQTIRSGWRSDGGKTVRVAEHWQRTYEDVKLLLLTDPLDTETREAITVAEAEMPEMIRMQLEQGALVEARSRIAERPVVKQYQLSGAEVLEENDWPGSFLPIIPIYGEEVSLNGERIYRSLITDAKDSQRDYNYWRSAGTELVGIAPRVPWLVQEGTVVDPDKWARANKENVPYLEYSRDASSPPQRQPIDAGSAVGAMMEARLAKDDMKGVMGIFDASRGERSNETSGKAIMARQKEGDVATYHFQDNQSRAVVHTGRVLVDLIPKVYSERKMVRILGEINDERIIKLGEPEVIKDREGRPKQDKEGNPITQVFNLSVGRYDVAIDTGPNFATLRDEASSAMTEMIRVFPAAAPILARHLARVQDWPGADDIADDLDKLNPTKKTDGIPPEIKQQIQKGLETIKALTAANEEMKTKLADEAGELQIKAYNAWNDRLEAMVKAYGPGNVQIEAIPPVFNRQI